MTEIDQPSWRKSSFSGDGDCLEWLVRSDGVRLRNSKRPDTGELHITHAEWDAFLAGVKMGEADTSPQGF